LKRSVAKLNRAGVDIVLGPDTGTPGSAYGFTEHLGMETLVDAGMSPMEVIVAATARPARIMGYYDRGSLVEGKIASFIVLNQNPLENIRNTRRIADVYQDGVRLDRAAMSAEILARASH
jgi:imidazolonepropionase-like amidohydrolase